MFKYPPEFSEIISAFSPLFSKKVFEHAGQLLFGALLTRGKRTVCGILRTLGLKDIRNWSTHHRVLSRAKWSALQCARCLIQLLVKRFVGGTTLVLGIDETIERRWGPKLQARGIYRDAVRSSKSHFVKCSGLRWIVVMVLCPIGWANRIWALPFLTVLSPSKRYYEQRGKRHKKLSDWTRQICLLLSRWLPDFQLIMVGDAAYSIIDLLDATRNHVNWITRIRIDAALFDFATTYQGRGRPRITGKKLPTMQQRLRHPNTKWQQVCFSKWYKEKNKSMEITSGKALWYRTGKTPIPLKWVIIRDPNGFLDPVAIQCTDLDLSPIQIVKHYLKRWQVEVTFEEVRTHLGVETQRQWAELSIHRTTPILMALFSLTALWADQLNTMKKLTIFQTTWYHKDYPTFSDAIASVRYRIWQYQIYLRSAKVTDRNKKKNSLIDHLAFMVARAI